ncbi:hypothetical protein I4U23_019632 [Adineta vaga]|nr:hypothetical protein I4U23_019632 [Adineta vaga]
MALGTFDIHLSTNDNDRYHLFYAINIQLYINIPMDTEVFHVPSYDQLFRRLDNLIIEFDSSITSCWQYILELLRIRRNTSEDK